MQFGDRIKQLRKEENMSQQELADIINVSKSAISMYENNNRVPELGTFIALADYFNVDMDYLKGKSDIKRKSIVVDNDDYKNEHVLNKLLMTNNQTVIDILTKISKMKPSELEALNSILK